ncbi:MAG: hypothetical protein HUU35_15285 [Armatimonadetes bacterium]|nr:hypothetical protein [Armatimonadota bacterium]
MRADDDQAERRKEQVEQAVDKAKQGARRLAGWLGERVGQAADKLKETELVRDQMDKLERFQDERAQERMQAGLTDIYDSWATGLQKAIEVLEADAAGVKQSCDAINVSVNALRLRGVSETDPEMREYQGHLKELRSEIRASEEAVKPLADEIERIGRQRRATVARWQADPGLLTELRADAERHVAESRERLGSLAELVAGEPPAESETTEPT